MYKIEDVQKSSLDYFNGDDLAASVWVRKYALKDVDGNYYELNPNGMHKRLAKEFARIESRYPNPLTEDEIFKLLQDFKYIVPQGSPMSGIGNDFQVVSISNCFVIGNNSDSYGGIMKTDHEQVQLMKRRGGVGHDLSHLRPNKAPVLNSAITSSGVASFMERYSNSTREVGQDGRRGALMLSISVKHPDTENFIDAKLEKGKVTGANISVKIDDEFMQAVYNGTTYIQQFPIDSDSPIIVKDIDARQLWSKIIHNAWESAEPGILFWDTVLRESPARGYGADWKEVSTNPCGEIPLNPYDSCRLLAINLFSYVDNPFTKYARFNFDLFKKHVCHAQRLSDDIVDLEIEKVDKIINKIKNDPEQLDIKQVELDLWQKVKNMAVDGRRTGTGVTGEGDMLAALGLRYGSEEAIDFSVKVHKTLAIEAYKSSIDMAVERGAFPIFDSMKDLESEFITRIAETDRYIMDNMGKYGRRNIALLTIAPTGTTSLMTQTTSGIEPCFLPYYKRRRKVDTNEKGVKIDFIDEVGDSWTEYIVFHHNFLRWAKINDYDENTVKGMTEETLKELFEKSPYFGATSNDIDWVAKVHMQGEIQKFVDHSISVTVNLPASATENLILDIYSEAHKSGCKGITVYREGSRSGVLVATDKKEVTGKRPKELPCDIHYIQANKNKYYVLVGLLNDKPYEIFAFSKKYIQIPQLHKEGTLIKVKSGTYNLKYNGTIIEDITQHFEYPEEDGFTRMVSLLLRRGIPVEDIIDQVDKSNSFIGGFYKAITRVLKKNYVDSLELDGESCPLCGNTLQMIEGCKSCSCGYSACS